MKTSFRSWMRFNTVGIIGVGVQLAILTLLISGFNVAVLPATAIAVECAVLHNFMWHERWTWAHRSLDVRKSVRRLLRFNASNGLISITGNVVVMWLLVGRLHMHYILANVAAIPACALVNFLVSDRLIFR